MTTSNTGRSDAGRADLGRDHDGRSMTNRASTETKASFKTSELAFFVAMCLAVLIASWAIGTTDNHADYFRGDKAWFYITLLTIGYMVSRGLAKAGSRDYYDR